MSIYASTVCLDGEEHDDGCPGRQPGRRTRRGHRVNPTCSCGRGTPIAYRGSHILPADDDERAGHLSLAQIPSWISRDGREIPDDGRLWPWLRLTVEDALNTVDVVLDARQVQHLHAELGQWLDGADRTAL
nr:hypothetical protein [Micromonospora sp. DSM 115978]